MDLHQGYLLFLCASVISPKHITKFMLYGAVCMCVAAKHDQEVLHKPQQLCQAVSALKLSCCIKHCWVQTHPQLSWGICIWLHSIFLPGQTVEKACQVLYELDSQLQLILAQHQIGIHWHILMCHLQ